MPASGEIAWLETEDRGDIWGMPRVWEAHLIPVKRREESLDRGCKRGNKMLRMGHDWRPDVADGGRDGF
jgi:hypothetical protein